MGFGDQINAWVAKTGANTKKVAKGVADECFTRVKDRTPVDTGALRDAWAMHTNADVILITNPKPYAPVVEYGLFPNPPKKGHGKTANGFSTQAPAGMVGITFVEIPDILQQIADKL